MSVELITWEKWSRGFNKKQLTILQAHLKSHRLTHRDIITWLNYQKLGITQCKLGKLLGVSEDVVFNRIKKVQERCGMRKTTTLVMPSLADMWQYDSARDDEHTIQNF